LFSLILSIIICLFREAIEKDGIFKMVYTDNASLFNYLRHKKWSWKVYNEERKFYDSNLDKQVIAR
jgi:hypothetical protein